jgi:hypothetical protein
VIADGVAAAAVLICRLILGYYSLYFSKGVFSFGSQTRVRPKNAFTVRRSVAGEIVTSATIVAVYANV